MWDKPSEAYSQSLQASFREWFKLLGKHLPELQICYNETISLRLQKINNRNNTIIATMITKCLEFVAYTLSSYDSSSPFSSTRTNCKLNNRYTHKKCRGFSSSLTPSKTHQNKYIQLGTPRATHVRTPGRPITHQLFHMLRRERNWRVMGASAGWESLPWHRRLLWMSPSLPFNARWPARAGISYGH